MLYKLESLRGILACAVIIAHSPYSVNKVECNYWIHLDILIAYFFILSGFIMALAYDERISKGLSFKSYFILRLGRIYPLHLFTLIVWLIYIFIKQYAGLNIEFEPQNNISTFISNLLLIHSLGIHDHLSWNFPSWSISTEFYTYLIFYILQITLNKQRGFLIPALIVIASYTLLFNLDIDSIGAVSYDYGFFRTLGGFYLGVILFRLKKMKKFKLQHKMNLLEVLPFFIFFSMVSLPYRLPLHDIPIILSFVLMVFIFSENDNGIIGKFLNINLFKTIGKYSFSIYLLHIFVLSIFDLITIHIFKTQANKIHGVNSIIINLLVCAVTIFLSKYTYVYIENYFRIKAKEIVKKNKNLAEAIIQN